MSAAAERTWDALAAGYGRQERLELRAIGRALDLAGPATSWVDLATGTGLVLRELACRPDRPAQATGVDRAEQMLDRVGELPRGWSVVRADATAVPLADASADVVSVAFLLHLLTGSERAAVLAEAHRLLGPQGRLVTVTVWCDRRAPGGRLAHEAFTRLAAARPERFGGLHPLDPTGDLHSAGFDVGARVQVPRGGYPSLVLSSRRRTATSR